MQNESNGVYPAVGLDVGVWHEVGPAHELFVLHKVMFQCDFTEKFASLGQQTQHLFCHRLYFDFFYGDHGIKPDNVEGLGLSVILCAIWFDDITRDIERWGAHCHLWHVSAVTLGTQERERERDMWMVRKVRAAVVWRSDQIWDLLTSLPTRVPLPTST